jgi:hypothetical protein
MNKEQPTYMELNILKLKIIGISALALLNWRKVFLELYLNIWLHNSTLIAELEIAACKIKPQTQFDKMKVCNCTP